jgi:hypothetical protein
MKKGNPEMIKISTFVSKLTYTEIMENSTSPQILKEFVTQTMEFVNEYVESKTDNGKIGVIEWFRIIKEGIEAVRMFDDLKGHGAHFASIRNAEISQMASEIYGSLSTDATTQITEMDVVHLIYLVRSLSGLVVSARN